LAVSAPENIAPDNLMPRTLKPQTLMVVAAALVDRDGRLLVQERPEGGSMAGLWEFPGGKLEAGETPEAALIRELDEELGIDVPRLFCE
jgi:8-oxo-dGTP diphosphatase